ncbi:type II toxin-antitoxin system Phd/YefM family antitoxin [Streptomyces sp. NPDC091040]|uniref:type II toxin-antitoxin system Phd/YefM family antitoxin n=1 Tax=Streptomyces sp. NPDC091040 TaxID=3365972 RepID=UPI00381EA786
MSITASEARKHLFPLIEQVNEDHAPVHITSRKGNAVLMSEQDFTSWQETIYLLRTPPTHAGCWTPSRKPSGAGRSTTN